MKMDKKPDSSPPPPPPPPSVGDYDDSQSTYTVDQPPPAYRKPELPAIKLAKIVAATILLVTFIIGLTSVAIVYMQHNMKCAETIVVTKASSQLPDAAKLAQQETSAASTAVDDEDDGGMRPPSTTSGGGGDDEEDVGKFMFPNMMAAIDGDDDKLKRLNFPIHIDMDELTGKMMENNQRARLNCVIEKKRSEEIIPRAPKTLQTPFGNLTTDPKFTHVTGETMSLTCRSGNDRVSRPATMSRSENGGVGASSSGSAPILIQIPLPQRPGGPGGPPMMRPPMMMMMQQQQQQPPPPQMQMRHMASQQQQQQLNPLSNMPALLGPLQALHEIQRMHQQRQQQQQQQQQRPPAGMQHVAAESNQHHQQEEQQQEQQQQRLLPQLARHFPMPLLPLPQISLHQMIPQLLDVHKQLQQERRREEQQQREAANNSQQQQQNNNNRNNRNNQEESHRDQQQQEQREREQQEVRVAEGRALSMQHDIQQMLQRVPPPPPPPPPPQHHPEEFFGRPVHRHQLQHLEQGHEEQVLGGGGGQESQHIPLPHHVVEQEAQRSREDVDDVEGPEGDLQEQRPPQQQEQQQQQQQQQAPPHQEHMGIQLDVAPSFHEGPHIVPADLMMMSRAIQHPAAPPPAPFLIGSHNMQPRSSSRPRMKRAAAPLAGSCSCVCK